MGSLVLTDRVAHPGHKVVGVIPVLDDACHCILTVVVAEVVAHVVTAGQPFHKVDEESWW